MARRKSEPLKCRFFFPNGSGGYTEWNDLTLEEQEEWRNKIVERIGKVFNDYFSLHPEVYAKI